MAESVGLLGYQRYLDIYVKKWFSFPYDMKSLVIGTNMIFLMLVSIYIKFIVMS